MGRNYIMMFVYDAIDADVGESFGRRSESALSTKPSSMAKYYGQDKVRSQIDKVVTIMELCENMEEFSRQDCATFEKDAIASQFRRNQLDRWRSRANLKPPRSRARACAGANQSRQ